MTVVLADLSSQRFYRLQSSYRGRAVRARASQLDTLEGCVASKTGLRGERILQGIGEDVIQLLVPKHMRRPSGSVAPRAWSGPTPRGSFWHVRGDFLVCSPEFLAVLMAERLGFLALVEYLHELCGTYSVDPLTGALFQREPLTTVARIEGFLDLMPGERGTGIVRRALAYVHDGSASPRETQLAMLLSLPTRMGGFGLGDIALNRGIDVSDNAETSCEMLRADVVLPPDRDRKLLGVAIEYESDEWHDELKDDRTWLGTSRLANDSMRRRAYVAAGYFAITVTNDEIKDYDELCGIVAQVRRKRGMRRLSASEEGEARRRALHTWLLAPANMRGDEPCAFRSRAK